jgi:hypothetical protein
MKNCHDFWIVTQCFSHKEAHLFFWAWKGKPEHHCCSKKYKPQTSTWRLPHPRPLSWAGSTSRHDAFAQKHPSQLQLLETCTPTQKIVSFVKHEGSTDEIWLQISGALLEQKKSPKFADPHKRTHETPQLHRHVALALSRPLEPSHPVAEDEKNLR